MSTDQHLEASLKQLETIIEKMENGSFTLQENIEAFSKGKKLIKQSQTLINDAKQTVKILMDEDKNTLKDYDVQDDNK